MMTDVFSKEKRSWVMSRIRGKDTKIEKTMAGMLSASGIEFVRHPKMYGNPDFLVRSRTVVFCDGDFWHGYDYLHKKRPVKKFWRDKIEGNMRRDRLTTARLRRKGYCVLRFWEHDLEKRPEICLLRILRLMR